MKNTRLFAKTSSIHSVSSGSARPNAARVLAGLGLYVLLGIVIAHWILSVPWPWDAEVTRRNVQPPALLEQIEQFEQQLREYPEVFNWKVHNELRHLYGATNLRKSMEHSNIILEHSLMDDYILNILSGWQIGKDTSKARVNLLMNARSFPDLRFVVVACLFKIGDLYAVEGNLKEARAIYLKVAKGEFSDMAQYRKLAEERLNRLEVDRRLANQPPNQAREERMKVLNQAREERMKVLNQAREERMKVLNQAWEERMKVLSR